jgi:predicted Na+-dependent transporter
MDIAAAPTMIVSKIKVNIFLLLAIATAAKSNAHANIRHGETALCISAPAQRAPPKARAR